MMTEEAFINLNLIFKFDGPTEYYEIDQRGRRGGGKATDGKIGMEMVSESNRNEPSVQYFHSSSPTLFQVHILSIKITIKIYI